MGEEQRSPMVLVGRWCPRIRGDDAEAETLSDVVFLLLGDREWKVQLVGRYHDVLHHHEDGTWRFHRRQASFVTDG